MEQGENFQNPLMVNLNKYYPHLIEFLTESYILAVPNTNVLSHCTIDEIFIMEHMLQSSFDGKELQSLSGKTYVLQDKRLILSSNPKIQIIINSTDVCYADNNGKHFKRMLVNNTLDQRFYRQQDQQSEDLNQNEVQQKKVMRDPFEMIQFFKEKVYHGMDEDYDNFLEDIKLLKENHILMKGHEQTYGKHYKKIGENFRKCLAASPEIREEFSHLDESQENETLENFVDVLIYERIGSYLRKTLIKLYQDEETKFSQKLTRYHQMYKTDIKKFNEYFHAQLTSDMIPDKSLQIFKVFFRCQLPYEMMYALHQTVMMATQEFAQITDRNIGSIDADTLAPFLILIIIMARQQLEQEKKPFNFKVRLLMMNNFSVHVFGMNEQDYSFVSFLQAEKTIDESNSIE